MDLVWLRLQHEKDLETIKNEKWHGNWLKDIGLTCAILREMNYSQKEDEYLGCIQDNMEGG